MDKVPVIDISAFESGGPEIQRSIAREVARAVEEIGFLTVTGHGVPDAAIGRMRDSAWTFFRLPVEAKRRYLNPKQDLNRGYTPLGDEYTGSAGDEKAPADIREGFIFGPFDVVDGPHLAEPGADYAYQPNIWPDAVPGLAHAFRTYYRAVDGFNNRLVRVLARALDLPIDFFLDKFDHHASPIRLLHYPALETAPIDGQLRCGEHTDFGSHTILLADGARGGLQVRTRAGKWTDVIPPANSFIVNIGDLLMRWTNDRWLSNLHRVANPSSLRDRASDRLSIAFFVHPNPDAVIECIPTCRGDGAPARHPPVRAGDYRRMMVTKTSAAAQ